MEETLLKAPAVREDLDDVVLEGNAFGQIFTCRKVREGVTVYTDRRPEIMSVYNLIAVYDFGFR
jgi:hypothetical protein